MIQATKELLEQVKAKNMASDRQCTKCVCYVKRYKDKYAAGQSLDNPFVLYEKYSRRDVCLLMNCGKDLSSTMY